MRMVLGIGGTEDAILALERTVARVGQTGDSLTIAILDNPAAEMEPEEVAGIARQTCSDHGVEATVTTLPGDPGPALTEFAETNEFDRIVLGGGKRSPMGKISLGAIAEFVVLNADVSVTLIR